MGAVDALAWCLTLLKGERKSKAAATIRGEILEIVQGRASDFEYRMRAVA
jgi:hypothetical protein